MPLYQQIVLTMPQFGRGGLAQLFRRHARTVLDRGGVVRTVEHHGLRPLLERSKK